MTLQQADAKLAWLTAYAYDMHVTMPLNLEPTPDPRLAPDWILRGYLIGIDAVARSASLDATRVCYGFVAESAVQPGRFVLSVRGTASPIEWFENTEFFQVATPWAGKAEAGFYGILESLIYRRPGGQDEPLIPAITALMGSGSLTIVGHSLGSAIASMLALQVSPALGGRVTLRVFASPRPGDQVLMSAIAAAVPDHRHYANTMDLVPKVPFGLSYAHLPNTIAVESRTALVRIKFGPGCLHHIESYIALLDPDYVLAATMTPVDQQNAACIVFLGGIHALAPAAP